MIDFHSLAMVGLLVSLAQSSSIRITEPEGMDPVVLTDENGVATIKGTASVAHDKVILRVDEKEQEIPVRNGKWSAKVALPEGPATLKIKDGPELDIWATRGKGIQGRGCLQVEFVWSQEVDRVLTRLASKTLDGPPSGRDLEIFLETIKNETLKLYFGEAFRGLNVKPAKEGAEEVHRVMMYSVNKEDRFGGARTDCGDQERSPSKVYVGTFEDWFEFCVDEKETPMRRSDSWEVRAQDVAYALARTAAHETGHALGLVGRDKDAECAWMNGKDAEHHHLDHDKRRFGAGNYVMDSSHFFGDYYRIGESSQEKRGKNAQRVPLQFCPFDISYLKLLYPLRSDP